MKTYHLKKITVMRAATCLAFLLIGQLVAPRSAITGDPETPKKVLLLTHSAGYHHACLPKVEEVMASLGEELDWLEVTALGGEAQKRADIDLSMISSEGLADYDAVMAYTTGELPLSDSQKTDLLEFVRSGGAFIGVHSATDTFYKWGDWGEVIGGYFWTHGPNDQPLTLKIEDADHPATRMLEEHWTLKDEFYRFSVSAERSAGPVLFSRDRVHVLLSVDMERSDIEPQKSVIPWRPGDMEAGGDYPLAWCSFYGEGRSFYTALGHRSEHWSDPAYRGHLLGGMRWALGLEPGAPER